MARRGLQRSTGDRDRPVTIEQRPTTDAVDGSGAPSEVGQWTTLSAVEWMERYDLSGDERFVEHQRSAFVGTIWNMTYRSDMDPEAIDVPKLRRLSYQGRYYDIVSAMVVGANDSIDLETLVSAQVPA